VIVEADGRQHGLPEGAERDRVRDAFLGSQGFQVLRFWNSDIDQNLEGVLEAIFAALKTPTPASLCSADPPHKGEG
jgi:very-short-patch-repair endonuclease